MKKNSVFTLLTLLGFYTIYGQQGILQGKITDENGEDLIGATVVLKNSHSVATIADFEGQYQLKIPAGNPQVVIVSFVSYNTITDTVTVGPGKRLTINYSLEPAVTEIKETVIYGVRDKSNDAFMRKLKMVSPNSIDYISKETIKKTGDSYVDDAIKRITGVSMVQGFLTVRGLADRYVKTTINGAKIPTLDPLTNNIKLDIFPTTLIDNIVITKTQNADLPADWAGAYLSIETKHFPEKLMVNVKTSIGYNPASTFQDIITAETGPTDWLGYDNGFRDIRHMDPESFPNYSGSPTPYQEFMALGMEDYINGLGLDAEHLGGEKGVSQGLHFYDENIYYRLALIQLGLLAPGHLYSSEEVYNATQRYAKNQKNEAFALVNRDIVGFAQGLPFNYELKTQKASLGFSQDFTIGNKVSLFGKPLGLLVGFRYQSSTNNDDKIDRLIVGYRISTEVYDTSNVYARQQTVQSNGWNALLNASYKLNPNHGVTLLFMPNFLGVNLARQDKGYSADIGDGELTYVTKVFQQYEERKQMVCQARTRHFFPVLKIKAKLDISYTNGESSLPDYKDFNNALKNASSLPTREYRYLNEDILDARLLFDAPFFEKPGLVRRFKFGGAYFRNDRESRQYRYEVNTTSSALRLPRSNNEFDFIENAAGLYTLPYYYTNGTHDIDFSVGYNIVWSGFALVDYAITKSFRVSGGFRAEDSDMLADIKKYHDMGLEAGDSARVLLPNAVPGGLSGFNDALLDPGIVRQTDYLPTVNLVYKLIDNEKIAMNMRGSYSKSIARPSIREIAPYFAYDKEYDKWLLGNPNLEITKIDNYDLRCEAYYHSGEFLSVSSFFKDFENHIELQWVDALTWINATRGKAYGVEFEGKKKLFDGFAASANFTYVYSRTEAKAVSRYAGTHFIDRPMYGQAPYIINGLLDYSNEKLGVVAALSYNVQGPKLAIASDIPEKPDIYELPRHILDFKMSKSIGPRLGLELKIRNILNQSVTLAWDGDDNIYNSYGIQSKTLQFKNLFNNHFEFEIPYESYKYGTWYIFSLSWKL